MRRFIFIALLTVGCGSASYNAPYVALNPPPMETRTVRHVEGRDCTGVAPFTGGYIRSISARQAMEHALDGTGATAIRDAEIQLIGGFETCIVVSGTAVVHYR